MYETRKNSRLEQEIYKGARAYSITLCIEDRRQIFLRLSDVNWIRQVMHDVFREEFLVHVFTFMPDHMHMLLEGCRDDTDLVKAMKLFKQKTGFLYKKRTGKQLWQKGYYDHVLRDDEAIEGIGQYILNNPVRAGIVKAPLDYDLSGSFVYEDLNIFLI